MGGGGVREGGNSTVPFKTVRVASLGIVHTVFVVEDVLETGLCLLSSIRPNQYRCLQIPEPIHAGYIK
jgi:hypothetical protein